MVTDESNAYNRVHLTHTHKKVDHREKEDIRKENILIHRNSIEGFWCLLKIQIYRIHHFVNPKHYNAIATNLHLSTIAGKHFRMTAFLML